MASLPAGADFRQPDRDDPVDALWSLLATPTIDPGALATAIERALEHGGELDWRTIQLIKEGWEALGQPGFKITGRIHLLTGRDGHDEVRFPSLKERLVPPLNPTILRQFLRELGSRIGAPADVSMGGAASLVLRGLLHRATEDVDLVDEVPVAIRSEHALLQELAMRHGLRVTHFQGHYLPEGWAARTTDAGTFGKIRLRLVDPADIIAGKVYSPRAKDLDDFRMLCEGLDRSELRDRVIHGLPSRWSDPEARARAIQNWYIAYGEALPDG